MLDHVRLAVNVTLHARYAVCGTEIVYAATQAPLLVSHLGVENLFVEKRFVFLEYGPMHSLLLARYEPTRSLLAMRSLVASSADYQPRPILIAVQLLAASAKNNWDVLSRYAKVQYCAINLCACYAMSGTNIAYGATGLCAG
eukprot:1624502-Rhodomonas_salina.1